MARPITWNDVAAPQFGAPLAASAAAARQVSDALSGLGDTARGYVGAVKEDATRAAVADIMSAADPVAAAAAMGQSWKIDPLAAQQAVVAADQRRQTSLANVASLAASKTTTELNRAALDDRVANREAADLSAPVIDEIVRTGKLPVLDRTKPEWQTAGGNLAHERVLKFYGDYMDDKRATENLYWQRKQATKNEANQRYLNWEAERGATPDLQLADSSVARRESIEKAKEFGADLTIVDQGLAYAENRGSPD